MTVKWPYQRIASAMVLRAVFAHFFLHFLDHNFQFHLILNMTCAAQQLKLLFPLSYDDLEQMPSLCQVYACTQIFQSQTP